MAAGGNRGGSSTRISKGMMVYGIFRGADGSFVSEGTVVNTGEDGFEVWYGKRQRPHTHTYGDIGKNVYTDREQALRRSEDRNDTQYEQEREDFAEQNTQPFWKI